MHCLELNPDVVKHARRAARRYKDSAHTRGDLVTLVGDVFALQSTRNPSYDRVYVGAQAPTALEPKLAAMLAREGILVVSQHRFLPPLLSLLHCQNHQHIA